MTNGRPYEVVSEMGFSKFMAGPNIWKHISSDHIYRQVKLPGII